MIESGKMIHMPVRDKNIADAQKLARCERREIAKVEQKCASLEHEIDV